MAVDFIHSNRDAANNAAGPVIRYYVRQNPSEEKYRDFYLKRFGRSLDRQAPLDQNVKYWQDLMTAVGGHGAFDELAGEERDRYYRYWIGKLKGKFPAEDDYQLTLLNWQLLADRNQAAWATGVDKQFEIGYKPGDSDRVIKWMGIYREDRQKVDQYYQKLDLAAMDFEKLCGLMQFLYRIGRQEQARNIQGHFKFDQLSDAQIEGLARSLWHVDNARVKDIYFRMKDNNKAKFNFMEFCHWSRNAGEGLPMATELTALPAYAKNAWAKKADFLVWTKQYNEAIAAYRMVDNPPGNLWSIVSCYTALGTTDAAISQLGEIERFFESESSRAALAIAEIHSKTGAKEKYISALRGILKKYPNSGESSVAHQRLEALGVKIGGAVDAR